MTEGTIFKTPENLSNPRDYKASDSGSAQTRPAAGVIQKLSMDQTYNNDEQSKMHNGPSEWGKPTMSIGRASGEAGTAVKTSYSVDLKDGMHSC